MPILFNLKTIKQFRIGDVVADTGFDVVTATEAKDIGHIVGLDKNVCNELLYKVEFVISGTRLIHPSNITLLSRS